MSEFHRLEIKHFFEVYKQLAPGKAVSGISWAGREEAEAEVREARAPRLGIVGPAGRTNARDNRVGAGPSAGRFRAHVRDVPGASPDARAKHPVPSG